MRGDDALVRPERPEDHAAVHRVNRLAFGRESEADLVDALRAVADPWISLVAELGAEVVGHVAFSPVRIVGEKRESRAMGLAPLAVLPEHQRCGIGGRLITAGLEACRAVGEEVVFVLGHAGYYPRFGFRPAAESGLHYRETTLEPSFMVVELAPGALRGRSGRVRYHETFERF